LRIFSIAIFKIIKGLDIELIFTLVNKKGSLQKVKAAKIDINIQVILYLACREKMRPLCSGKSRNFRLGI